MTLRRARRWSGADPLLLRRLHGGAVSVVDQPAGSAERAFATAAVLAMVVVSAWMMLA